MAENAGIRGDSYMWPIYTNENYDYDENLESLASDEILHRLCYFRKKTELLDCIIENMPDGIYITDGDANAIRINPAFERISGLDRNKMLGRNHRDLVKEGMVAKSSALAAIEYRKLVTIIHEYPPTRRNALVSSNPLFDSDENIYMVVSSIRDVSELVDLRTKLEIERSRSQKYQMQLDALKSQMLSDNEIIIEDEKMLDVIALAKRMAQADSPVLLTGETGVGKEEVAKYIHRASPRHDGLFTAVNCGALPEALAESELFGYESGAFTGARREGKIGLIEATDKGTLFLDEVGELPLSIQVKLLRVLQEKRLTRVGGTKPISTDIRLISATNRNLEEMIQEHSFREDLYYRLSVLPIKIPPLRERKNDILPLAMQFLKDLNNKYLFKKSLSSQAQRLLLDYSWPGNVRELKNLVERAAITCDGQIITPEDFPIRKDMLLEQYLTEELPLKERLARIEYAFIKDAYEKHASIRKAALSLGMKPTTFIRKKQEYEELFKEKHIGSN